MDLFNDLFAFERCTLVTPFRSLLFFKCIILPPSTRRIKCDEYLSNLLILDSALTRVCSFSTTAILRWSTIPRLFHFCSSAETKTLLKLSEELWRVTFPRTSYPYTTAERMKFDDTDKMWTGTITDVVPFWQQANCDYISNSISWETGGNFWNNSDFVWAQGIKNKV